MTTLSLPIQSYRHRSPPASTSRLVNAYVEPLGPDARAPMVLSRTPGVASWATVGNGPIQAMHASTAINRLFVVSDGVLYAVTTAGAAVSLGTVGTGTEIDIDDNGTYCVVVNKPNAWYADASTLTAIADADFTALGAGDVEFDDNYLLFRAPNTGKFFGSDLGSASSFDALNFATAEGSPDNLVGMKVDHRQVLLFGDRSLELWENTGISGFPFERMINGFVELGCLAGRSPAKLDNSVFWVADDYTVRRLDGATPVRVSTFAVEQWLRTLASPSTLHGHSYTFEGHLIYELSADEGTFAYDVSTQLWHEKATYGETNWVWRWPCNFAGKLLVGDWTGNTVGYLSSSVYGETGASVLRSEWTYQPVYAQGAKASHERLEVICEVGVGLATGQGSDPEIMCDYSDDGGQTWKSLPNKKLGQGGKYLSRVFWVQLGSSRQRVYRMACSDPVRLAITDTQLTVEGGRL